jgi:hypothetical protein
MINKHGNIVEPGRNTDKVYYVLMQGSIYKKFAELEQSKIEQALPITPDYYTPDTVARLRVIQREKHICGLDKILVEIAVEWGYLNKADSPAPLHYPEDTSDYGYVSDIEAGDAAAAGEYEYRNPNHPGNRPHPFQSPYLRPIN